jgi:protease IV
MTIQKTSPLVKKTTQLLAEFAVSLVNSQRTAKSSAPYIQFTLPAVLSALPEHRNLIQQRLFGKSPLSLYELERHFERIAKLPHIEGVILNVTAVAIPLADLMTLRDSMLRLKAKGKRVICYAQGYDTRSYFLASVADTIWIQVGGTMMTTGLVQQQVFLKNALDTVGLDADVVAISPYKSAADQLSLSEPSKESKEQTNWLLDSAYEIIINGIAEGRKKATKDIRKMVDNAPYTDKEALEQGWVEHICNEEGFKSALGGKDIITWEEAEKSLPLELDFSDEQIVVLPLQGMIVNGRSAQPPANIPIPLLGEDRMGDITVVQQIRQLMKDDSVKAVVLYVDSPGGSATASEAIVSALEELAKTRPVVVCMGNVAASGGYYISTCADWVIAQPATVTGSIGVVLMKLVNTEALKKLRFNPFTYMRGANAGIFASIEKFSKEERAKMVASIERIYEVFVDRVADARKMKDSEVDVIGGGRVWTGVQAHENGLVDQLGGLEEAITKARELAKVDADTPVRFVRAIPQETLPAQLAEKVDPAASVKYWLEGITAISSGQALYLHLYELR